MKAPPGNATSDSHYEPLGNKAPAMDIEPHADGSLILSCPYPLGKLARSTAHLLLERAEQHPDRTLIAEQSESGEWQHLSYAEAVAGCRQVAQWLLNRGAGVDRPLAILSASSRAHFLMAWGAIFARVPCVPVSVAYSTVAGAFPKLDAVLSTVHPAFIFAEDLHLHVAGLESSSLPLSDVTLISRTSVPGLEAVSWESLQAVTPTSAVDASIDAIDHQTVTRYMFTSGSTGMPKGVIYTHGMSCVQLASGAALRATSAVGAEEVAGGELAVDTPPVYLEWMPWSHVGGGVMRLAAMINSGTSIYLDTGRPVPGEFDKTLANLRTVKPTSYAGAPVGWAMLADGLEADEELAQSFFGNLTSVSFGSAAMPEPLRKRLEILMEKHSGRRRPMGTSLASTEVATCLAKYWASDDGTVLGLPMPGVEVKLVPFDDKYELRVRSGGVTPGYLHEPEKTSAAFDEDGFFRMGDAVRWRDPEVPLSGLVFAGRVAEEFKLQSGTWVSAGTLRADAVAAASPYVRDVVVCGLNDAYVALLVWPNLAACAELAGSELVAEILQSQRVREVIGVGFSKHNASNAGSSRRIARFLLLASGPDPGAYEVTDKGYVNQAATRENRAREISRLYAESPSVEVVLLPA